MQQKKNGVAFPGAKKIYVTGSRPDLRVPVRELTLTNGERLRQYDVSGPWTDPAQKNPKTIHHQGYGRFAVDGEMIKLKSRMR